MTSTLQSAVRMAGILGLMALFVGCSSEEPTTATGANAPGGRSAGRNSSPAAGRDVLAERLPYAEVGEELVYGHFAIPVDMIDPLPAVIVIHDGFGLNDRMLGMAERLAASGFIVLAVDLFQGRTAGDVSAARELQISVLENQQRALDNLGQALEFIRVSSGAPAIAVLGFGFGGGLALDASLQYPRRLDAVVSFYGQVKTDRSRLRAAEVPFLGVFLENDRAVPPQSVRDFEEVMKGLGHDATIHIFDEGRRGFMDPGANTYDAALADRAWEQAIIFLTDAMGDDAE